MKIKFTYYGFSRTYVVKEKQEAEVGVIDVGTENEKSSMSYLKFILKAFPILEAAENAFMRRGCDVNFRAISRQFPDPSVNSVRKREESCTRE